MKIRKLALLVPLLAAACDSGPALAPTAPAGPGEALPSRATSREGYLAGSDGTRLFYRVHGSGPDTIVVLSGGPGLSLAYLDRDLAPLANGRTVVYYDGRSAGRSQLLSDSAALAFEHYVADVEAVRRHFGLERLSLVGHSWGALVAAAYAAERPERTERLVLVTPGPVEKAYAAAFDSVLASRTPTDQLARQADLIERLSTGRVEDPEAACDTIFDLLFAATLHDPQAIGTMRGRWCDGPPEAATRLFFTLGASRASLGDWDLRPMLRRIEAPTLVVHGASDAIVRVSSEAFARSVPGARFEVIERSGHLPWLERPEVFFPVVNRFLRRGAEGARASGEGE